MIGYLWDRVRALLLEEEGQDGLEYLMVVAGVSVVLIVAIAAIALGAPSVVQATCDAVASVFPGDPTLDCTPGG